MRRTRVVLGPILAAVVAGATLTGCSTGADGASVRAALATSQGEVPAGVLVVSIDGLNPRAISRLGEEGTPALHRLVAEGASTMNARTVVKRTETLPNHTSMLTGRNIDRRRGGHGVEHNRERGGTVHSWAGHRVASLFEVLGWHGQGGALFASKGKFRLFPRSWPAAIDRFVLRRNNVRLVATAREDLLAGHRPLRFVHLSAPDVAGHRHGFMSPGYLDAVRRADRLLGRLVRTINRTPRLAGTTVIVTADHGGYGRRGHAQARRLANYRIPFLAWGPSVAPGADLYALNSNRRDPGTARVGWRGVQPVRNAEVANLALDVLGLPPVPGGRANRDQDLDLR